MTNIYNTQKEIHGLYLCNYSLPDVNYFYKNFNQWLKYNPGPEYCKQQGKLRKLYSSANILGYLGSSNPVSRFEHTIKGYMFLPGMTLEQYKNVEFYCENLTKAVKKDMKRASSNLLDFLIAPTTTGIYFTVYSKLPKLGLEMLSDLFKSMGQLAATSYRSTLSSDTVKMNFKKWDVVDLAYQQLMASLSLQVDDWEANLATNFISANDIAKRTLFAKTVLCFLGEFNVNDCIKKTEYMSNNFCYQRTDFFYPSLARHGILQPEKPIVLEHQFGGGKMNSAMLWFFQTRIDDFFKFYELKKPVEVKSGKYSTYEIAKLYTLMAHHLMQVEYFQSLRSEHCLGYHVYSRLVCQEGAIGVAYIVQSANNCPAMLALHTARFIDQNVRKLDPSQEDLRDALQAVMKKPLDRTYQKHLLINRLDELFYCNDDFGEYIQLPNLIGEDFQIEKKDFMTFMNNFYLKKAGSLQIHIIGGDHKSSQEMRIEDVKKTGFKCYTSAGRIRAALGLSVPVAGDIFENWQSKFN